MIAAAVLVLYACVGALAMIAWSSPITLMAKLMCATPRGAALEPVRKTMIVGMHAMVVVGWPYWCVWLPLRSWARGRSLRGMLSPAEVRRTVEGLGWGPIGERDGE